jgi:hypothetical protein
MSAASSLGPADASAACGLPALRCAASDAAIWRMAPSTGSSWVATAVPRPAHNSLHSQAAVSSRSASSAQAACWCGMR